MSKTPITLKTDGEWVWADGTSLGGDDTIGVACILAVLEDDTLPHPAIEAVLTVDEETGMNGAQALDASLLHGRRMINLDSEEDGVFTAGCAGGRRIDCSLPVERESVTGYKTVKVTLSGLLGGHSGADIHLERGNSHLLTARFLRASEERFGIRLVSIDGGKFDNVIPTKTEAVAAVPEGAIVDFFALAAEYDAVYKNEFKTSDPGVLLEVEEGQSKASPMSGAATRRVLDTLFILPNGVCAMSADIAGLTETSLSMGVINTSESEVSFCEFVRSSVESRKVYVSDKVTAIVCAAGGTCTVGHDYPGWEYSANSPVRDAAVEAYRSLFGAEGTVSATHGGLECGLISAKLPSLDCVAIGPELYDIHSVRERVKVSSVGRLYSLLCETLSRLR